MNYPHVDRVYGKFEAFSTEPLDAEINTQERVFAKPFNNIQGNLVLINEYICYKLCLKLGIEIPEAGIALIDEKTESKGDYVIVPANHGYCYYSKRIDKVTVINSGIIPKLSNKEMFYKIILFDHLVYNKDRNRGNLLVTSGKDSRLYAIDHTHVFRNQSIWNKQCFIQGMAENDFKDRDILNENRRVYDWFWEYMDRDEGILLTYAEHFKKQINRLELDTIINELPQSWHVSDEDTAALREYLLYRLDHIEEMCDLIVKG